MSNPERRRKRPPKVKTLIAFSSLIMLLFCVFVVFQASKAYETAIHDGRNNAQRLIRILGDQVELTFLAVDLTLRRVVERHYFNQMFGNNLTQDIENNMRQWVDETPQIASIILTDAKGTIQVAAFKKGYQSQLTFRQSYAQDPIFRSLSVESGGSFTIGVQEGDESNLILLARSIITIDGQFGGAVIAAVDPTFFLEFLSSVDPSSQGFMSIFLANGETAYAGPPDELRDNNTTLWYIRKRIAEDAVANPISQDATIDTETVGDTIQIIARKRLSQLPMYLALVIDEDDFLTEWRDARVKDISFLAIFTIFGSVLSFFALAMAKQIGRVEESEAAAILASQAKSEFLANMSHELRTPLNAIIGFSEMINAGYFGELNDKQKERIHDINLCGSHLLQLISDILEFSKGEAGKLELNEEEVNVPEIMEECTRIISDKSRRKHITMSVDIEGTIPMMRADKRKIRQIMLNLLSNSIKFTPEGGKIITAVRQEKRSGNIILSVTDNGVGIPENEIQKALSVFGQVHRSQSHEGTGLGLPLCKMFTELHGGKLTLTSKLGEGTTVSMMFPAERILRTETN
jgi:signal transduction histidine kinase